MREQNPEENTLTRQGGIDMAMHNEALHDLYCSPDVTRAVKSRKIRWSRHTPTVRTGEMRDACNVLVEKCEWKIPLRRPNRMWQDNIKVDIYLRFRMSYVGLRRE